jgi:hypothetical protein
MNTNIQISIHSLNAILFNFRQRLTEFVNLIEDIREIYTVLNILI